MSATAETADHCTSSWYAPAWCGLMAESMVSDRTSSWYAPAWCGLMAESMVSDRTSSWHAPAWCGLMAEQCSTTQCSTPQSCWHQQTVQLATMLASTTSAVGENADVSKTASTDQLHSAQGWMGWLCLLHSGVLPLPLLRWVR
jgi:hypothetical protein